MVRAKTMQNCTESGECSITRMFDHSSRKARNFGNIETKGAIINSSPILIFSATMRTSLPSLAKVRILARESVNSSPILARQWWRHFRLCLSLCLYLSLSPKVPHAQYRKRFRASYNASIMYQCLPVRLGHFSVLFISLSLILVPVCMIFAEVCCYFFVRILVYAILALTSYPVKLGPSPASNRDAAGLHSLAGFESTT